MFNIREHRTLRRLDLPLTLAVIGILIVGLITIASATHVNTPSDDRYWYLQRQGMFAVGGLIWAFMITNFFDYRALKNWGNKIYIFNLIMLLAVMFFGHAALGAQRWIQIGPISIQPSEFSKVIMIIALATLLESRIGHLSKWREVIPVALFVLVPFLLVAKQPDLGTGLVFFAIFLGMIFVAGISLKILGIVFGAFLAMLPIIWQFLHDYQKMRIMVFIDPNVDPLGSGYHIIQSKIAIGSGMLFGKGLFGGTQSQLNFLPENHTDFIFAVVGEEFGFIGAAFLLCLYLIVLWRGVKIARECKDAFGMLLASGITSMLAFHLLVNVGMTMGVMPVTGIPLPLMSYGVSSLLTNVTCLGLLMNIHMKQQSLHF